MSPYPPFMRKVPKNIIKKVKTPTNALMHTLQPVVEDYAIILL
jgi:hypothetical protein